MLCPVAYLPGGPFAGDTRNIDEPERVEFWKPKNFSLLVDGIEIRRPLLFPNPKAVTYGGPDPKLYKFSIAETVAGRVLKADGYVYAQQPHIAPLEIQGLQIRIRGVGIGGFDKTWMGYPWDEGIKFGQVMGEVYVSEGLESALNIDRASFRETDPHYLALRARFWEFLNRTVFPEFKSRQKLYRELTKQRVAQERQRRLSELLSEAPAVVGVAPTLDTRSQNQPIRRSKTSAGGSTKVSLPSEYQDVVLVRRGEASINKTLFEKLAAAESLQPSQEPLVQRICAVLAAFGVWDRLNQDESQKLLHALISAVVE